jgi:hypothetical protein
MAIDYPNSPTNGQTFTSGNKSWIWDGTTWLAYGASLSPSVLKVDTVNARVGINNQSPSAVLDVQASTGTAMRITNSGTGESFRVEDATGDITPFVIDSSGNVGMGTHIPLARLHITDGNANIRLNTSTPSADALNIVPPASFNSRSITLNTATLTAYRTVTLPDKTGTVALTSDPGLILVKTQTVGSGVSIVEVTDAFSSTYENYRIIYTGGSSSTSQALGLQFGIGSTMTTTNYFGAAGYINLGAAAWQLASDNPGSYAGNVGGGNTTSSYLMTDVLMPNMAEHTAFHGPYILSDFGRMGTHSFAQLSATQFTSFRIICNTGTLTGGTIRVYGYRNS